VKNAGWVKKSKLLILSEYVNKIERIGGRGEVEGKGVDIAWTDL